MKFLPLFLVVALALGETNASCQYYDNRRPGLYSVAYSYVLCQNITAGEVIQLSMSTVGRSTLKYIMFKNSSLPVIPVGFFSKVAQVAEVYLNSSQVRSIQPGAFNNMQKLQNLYLHDNDIKEIIRGNLNSLTSLQLLDLSGNHFLNIEEDALHGLSGLQTLRMANNNLTNASNIINYLSAVKSLDVSFNRLRNIDSTYFSNSSSIRYVNMSSNAIEMLDFSVFPKLLLLNVSCNNVSNVKDWSELKNIENVDLSSNNIAEISAIGTGTLYLILSNNKVRFLDSNLFSQSAQLKTLDLSGNFISKINSDAFSNLTKLLVLNLSQNQITQLPVGLFKDLKFLKLLYLSRNFITTLDFGTLAGLDLLEELHLEYNKIQRIEENSFHVINSLKLLRLSNNEISALDPVKLLSHVKTLKEIDLNNNNLFCNSLFDIMNTFKAKKVQFRAGTSYTVQNINGVACRADNFATSRYIVDDLETTTLMINEVLLRPLQETETFFNTSFYRFFNGDFKNSSFVKYFNEYFTNLELKNRSESVANYEGVKTLELHSGSESNGKLELCMIMFMAMIIILLALITGVLFTVYRSFYKCDKLNGLKGSSNPIYDTSLELL